MNLIIIGHPDKESFCYNGILKAIIKWFDYWSQEYEIIYLYEDKILPSRWYKNQEEVKEYRYLC
jgi:hypothetical protein